MNAGSKFNYDRFVREWDYLANLIARAATIPHIRLKKTTKAGV